MSGVNQLMGSVADITELETIFQLTEGWYSGRKDLIRHPEWGKAR